MSKKGFFITLEGTDGVGKTTHAKRLKRWMVARGKKVVLTREPGGGTLSEKIRKILLDPKTKIDNLTELFLYQSARVDHLAKVIKPALKEGKIVICDRFTDATVAYQGFARNISLDIIYELNRIATEGLKPHLTILLDLSPSKSLKKAKARKKNKKGDRLEREGLPFQNKVRQGYLTLARNNRQRIKIIKVQNGIEATQNLIRQKIKGRIKI